VPFKGFAREATQHHERPDGRGTAVDRQVLDAAAPTERGTFAVLAEGRDDPFPQLHQEPAKFSRFDSVG
jgi:hypothetical protein